MAADNTHGVAKLPQEIRGRILEALDKSAERKAALQRGSSMVLSLLRLKIVDDADLDTARQAVLDGTEFLRLLREYARAESKDMDEVLQHL